MHTEASLGWGGQEIRILTEAQGMIGRGHEVEIWAAPDLTILPEAARRLIPLRTLPIGRRHLAGLFALRRTLAAVRPDIVNTHSSTDTWLVALACLMMSDAPPIVRTRHISARVPGDFATRWLYTRAPRHIVTTGERLRETLIRDNGFPAAHITSVPTGIDTERFRPGDRMQARRTLGLDPDARFIGIVATLRSWKGHLYLIDAFARIADDDPRLRLIIVGDGPMHDPIRPKVAELGLAPRSVLAGRQGAVETWLQAMDVFCLPSYANAGVPQALIQAMLTALPIVTTPVGSIGEAVTDGATALIVPLKDVDALVLPTLYDPFPNVALEAMASGLPVITSTKCGAAELIESGSNGFVCDALDDAALAGHMRVLADPATASRMGCAARQLGESLSLEQMSRNMVALYRALLKDARPAASVPA